MSGNMKPNRLLAVVLWCMMPIMIMQGGTLVMVFKHLTSNPHPSRDLAEVNTALLKMRHAIESLEHTMKTTSQAHNQGSALARMGVVYRDILGVARELSAQVERVEIAYGDQRETCEPGRRATITSGATPAAYQFALVVNLPRQEDLPKMVDRIRGQPWFMSIDGTDTAGGTVTIKGRLRQGFRVEVEDT